VRRSGRIIQEGPGANGVIAAAAEAVVNAGVDLEEAEDWLARAFS
jgi:hypothetical protein